MLLSETFRNITCQGVMTETEEHVANGEAEITKPIPFDDENEKRQPQDSQVASEVNSESDEPPKSTVSKSQGWRRRIYDIIFWTPPRLRWNPDSPPKFSMGLNILFGFAGAFTVANLYYNHPILNILAHDFGVPYVKVSDIPTLAQAGYAAGLLFLCPLGDMLERRPFVLSLVFFTATMRLVRCF
jgi:hypothetical protein